VNIAFGGAILALLIFAKGLNVPSPTVGSVVAGSPAAVAGLQMGDRILAVDGQSVIGMDGILDAIARDPDRLLSLEVRRAAADMVISLDLRSVAPVTAFGIATAGREHVAVGPAVAIVESARITGRFVASSVGGIVEIITGERELDDLGGPIRIAEVSGQTFIELGLGALVLLTALLSVNIGIVNLLPIPVLDGGHIFIMALETLVRRDFSLAVKEKMLFAGFVALMALMVTVIYNDLTRIAWIERLMPWR
jgi:regulator of sigma E protease